MNLRYGRIHFKDLKKFILFIILLLTPIPFSPKSSFCITYCFIVLCITFFLFRSVNKQISEKFRLEKNNLIIQNGNRLRQKTIPNRIVMIISHPDICPPFSFYNGITGGTQILRDRYAVTILTDCDASETIKRIHKNFKIKYTTSTLQNTFFEYEYIYSFVCSEELFQELTAEREYTLILPKQFLKFLKNDDCNKKIFIDLNY